MHPTSRSQVARPRLLALALPVSFALSLAQNVQAADGTWNADAGGNWTSGVATNWLSTAAEGADFTAYFNAVNITANRTITLTAPLTIGNLAFGDFTTASHDWTLTGSTLTLSRSSGTPTITVDNRTATVSAVLAGTQGMVKAGAGILTLSGNNTFTGGVTVNAGTLDIRSAAAIGSNAINLNATGAVLDAANPLTGSATISGNITGTGKVTKTSSVSTLVLTGDNTYSGGTTLSAGVIAVGSGLNNGIGTGTLTLNSGAFLATDNNSRTFSNTIAMGSSNLRFGALQGDSTGKGDLNFTWTGSTSIGGSKTWTVNNATTASFANNWTGNSGWNVTKAGTGSLVFNGNLTSSGVGVVVSAGTFTLNGAANSYTGSTVVNGGMLYVNGAKTGSGAVTVNSTGTLAGNGTISGAASAASGSFLSPGSSSGAVGTLTFNSTLDVSGLASGTGGLLFNLDGAGSSDKIASGALTIGSGLLDLDDFGFTTLGGFGAGVYTLVDATSIIGTLGSSRTGTLGGYNATLSIDGINNDLILTVTSAIPEPSSFAALLGGVALVAVAGVRRRRTA